MTLRVYIDIIPFGVEDEAYPLHEISIHNIGGLSNGDNAILDTRYSFNIAL